MYLLFAAAGVIMLAVFFVCTIIVVVEAFKDSIWKGILFFLCWLYAFWYTLFEFKHDNKWGIVLGSLGGGYASSVLLKWAGWLN